MALRILERKIPVKKVSKSGFSWDQWYAANKARLSEKRARRYREDASYRDAALKRSRNQRQTIKKVITDGFTISFEEMSQLLGVTVWVLREWRRKDYFPEPWHRDGRLWFKQDQVGLLSRLQNFFEVEGVRVGETKRQKLQEVVSLVYSNWS